MDQCLLFSYKQGFCSLKEKKEDSICFVICFSGEEKSDQQYDNNNCLDKLSSRCPWRLNILVNSSKNFMKFCLCRNHKLPYWFSTAAADNNHFKLDFLLYLPFFSLVNTFSLIYQLHFSVTCKISHQNYKWGINSICLDTHTLLITSWVCYNENSFSTSSWRYQKAGI